VHNNYNGDILIELVYVQAPFIKEDIEQLKRKTKVSDTKKALQIAVEHYINCNCENIAKKS
jgi:hypothetical protein